MAGLSFQVLGDHGKAARVVDQVRAGEAVSRGGVIRNAQGKVLAHLQQAAAGKVREATRGASDGISKQAMAFKLLDISLQQAQIRLALSRIEVNTETIMKQNRNLAKLVGKGGQLGKADAKQLKELATLNCYMSAAGIAVSVAGFALLYHKLGDIQKDLGRMESKLGAISSGVNALSHHELETLRKSTLSHVARAKGFVEELQDGAYHDINSLATKRDALDDFRSHIESLVNRLQHGESISMPLELVYHCFHAYVHALHAYAIALHKLNGLSPLRLKALREQPDALENCLLSRSLLNQLYLDCLRSETHYFMQDEALALVGLHHELVTSGCNHLRGQLDLMEQVPATQLAQWAQEIDQTPEDADAVLVVHP